MARCLTALVLLCCGALLSGCGGVFLWAADVLHPASVVAIDATWSRDHRFCDSLIERTGRYAFLISGNVDDPRFKPTREGHYELGSELSPKDPMRDGRGPRVSILTFVKADGVTYAYAGRESIPFEETEQLPVPEIEREYADSAAKSAWRETLYRLDANGDVARECLFVTRLWANWSV